MSLTTSDFDYELPDELIARRPRRGASRLMVVEGSSGPVRHRAIADLPSLLRAGDLLVFNDTRVLHARLRGRRLLERDDAVTGAETSSDADHHLGGQVEALLIEPVPENPAEDPATSVWRAMLKPGKRQRPGTRLLFGDLEARVEGRDDGLFRLRFLGGNEAVHRVMRERGELPLPPYLGREADPRDEDDYQTVFARDPGAVAAPTAGLHFDRVLLEALEDSGVEHATVTLHVGPGTFRPVTTETVDEHGMDSERTVIPADTADRIHAARADGRRVIAVGTTVTRTLEGAAADGGTLQAGAGRTDLFIRPGHRFRVIDGLLTNFHLPRSTLIMLVAALVGRDRILDCYRTAVAERYRFYSYGDAMLLLP